MDDDRGPGTRRRGRPPGGKPGETRQRLLDAALELFARHGFAATSVRAIAGEIGLRDSAIYAHFPDKQAIYQALLAEMGPVSLAALDVAPEELSASEPRSALPRLVDRLVEAWAEPRALLFANVLLREGAGATGFGGPDGLAGLVDAAVRKLSAPFRLWQERGLLRADVAVEQLVWELFAPLHIARFLHLRAGATRLDKVAAADTTRAHVSFFLTCCTPPEGTSR